MTNAPPDAYEPPAAERLEPAPEPLEPAAESPLAPSVPRWRAAILGMIGLGVAVAAVMVLAVAIVRASAQEWALGTTLAEVAIGLTALSFVIGLVAVILGRGRRFGVAAMILSVIANPLVLVYLFRLLG